MKISAIKVHEVELGIALGPYKSAKSTISTLTTSLVCMETDEGIVGWGEVCPYGANYLPALHGAVRPIMAELSKVLIGRDPRMIGEINEAMDRAVMGQFFVKTALDYACWDILGKATGLPVYALLGGKLTPRLPLIASIPGGVEAMKAAINHYQAKGYRQFSLHMAAPDPRDLPIYRKVIAAFDADCRISIDANQSWTLQTAVEIARLFNDLPVALEQPCADLEQCASLRSKITQPLILDEIIVTPEDCMKAAALNACESIMLKIGRSGGLTKARQLCDAADALGIRYWIKDVSGSEVATLATAHLAHSRPSRNMAGALSCVDLVDTVTGETTLVHEEGHMFVPDMTPGLGFCPDMSVIGSPAYVLG